MPLLGPISRTDLVHHLRALGFTGPYSGRTHAFMLGRGRRVHLPNPNRGDISTGLLARILHQAGISREEWERL
jgi:predicted RNA binding protein YcfA (HicA-like mRNA interferase family)